MHLNSWGMYPAVDNKRVTLRDDRKLTDYLLQHNLSIPCGNGRSYEDSALSE
jgi:hypothetical protein